jgi:hypothetical protein
MSIKDRSPQSRPSPKSSQAAPKSAERKKKSDSSVGSSNRGTGVGGSVQSGSSSINGNSSWKSNQQDTSRVSKEAQQREKSSGSVGSLISGIGEWSGKSAQDGAPDRTEPQAGVKDQTRAPNQASGPGGETAQASLDLGQGELLGSGRNSSPEQVTQLQELLNSQGGQLEVDGEFGPRTEQAVREFQRENDLKIDGLVGPETQAALNGGGGTEQAPAADAEQRPPTAPGQIDLADPNLSPAEQYEHYRELIEANGGEINTDGATVLGLRGLGTDGQRHDGTSTVGGYDDSFVVLNRDANGQPTVQMFRGATHANQRTSSGSYGPDANGNTVRGMAMLAPGNYDVRPHSRNYRGNRGPSYQVTTLGGQGYVPAFRDLNSDGTISSSERTQAETGGYQASGILFHAGRGNAPSSIGCQTMPPELMRAFSDAVGFRGYNYTLLDANG